MTPTQPAPLDDAGAMAVFQQMLDTCSDPNCHFCAEQKPALAHLAARLAGADATVTELREELASLRVYVAANVERASRAEAELAEFKRNNRWNVRETDSGLAVCRGDHDKSQGCEEVLYVRADKAEAELAAIRELLAKGRRVPLCGDMPEAIVFVDADARALDAARGAG